MHNATLTSLSKIEVGQTILVTVGREDPRGFGRPKDPTAIPLRVTAKDHVPDEWTGKVWTLTLSDGTQTLGRYGTTHVYVTEAQEFAPEVELDLAVTGTRRVKVDPDGTMRVQDWTGGEVTERTPKGRLVKIAADGVLTILEDFPEDDADKAYADAEAYVAAVKPAVSDDEVASGERCHQCKGYGVVRKTGPKAGKAYRTLVGAEESTVKGNSEKCPVCKGATLLVRSA